MRTALAADRSLEATRAIADKRELQGRVEELEKDFEMEQQGTFDITQDMTRQYKGMQEELLNRVNTLENTITELRDQLGAFSLLLHEFLPLTCTRSQKIRGRSWRAQSTRRIRRSKKRIIPSIR